ncbi:MAG: radical SAM protein [Alicyclobacillus sp.]|nr:radical SAM protein [Alicyclobacillus sp.]
MWGLSLTAHRDDQGGGRVQATPRKVKSALTRQSGGFLNTFTHSLQPYAGCAFGQRLDEGQGCPYCYVRQLPVAKFAQTEWGAWVSPKANIAEVLRAELARHERAGSLGELRIFMSSATDPYQGAEASLRLTRACLEAFVERPPGLLVVQTRSPLVTRDIDLLQQLQPHVWVSLTLETNDDAVRRQITPTSPTVASRLRAMAALRDAGIPVQAAISPMLPNDPHAFAEALATVCDRALVDTLLAGDGANGRRSEALGMRALFDRLGYGAWYSPTAHEPLLAALRDVLGAHRVAFSQEGFNSMK